ncbi:hypothetical protein C8R47DRAFT_1080909 [Mycena vitilis]|nr:hypothetical protein C8R47DRAFT_1080909 [Mycena vitilis]
MYSVTIRKQAIGLTLRQIYAGPESSVNEFVVLLCRWHEQEARLILLELAASTSVLDRPRGWKPERFYDFLMANPGQGRLERAFPPFTRPPSIQESHFSGSSDSQETTTDTSTVWGPGTLSGRALLALGEATVRGIDALIIRHRLATIRLRAPSLTKSMHSDVLELCRPNMYSVTITKQATQLALAQICAGPESSLYIFVVLLCQWSLQEARVTLLQLVAFTSCTDGLKGTYCGLGDDIDVRLALQAPGHRSRDATIFDLPGHVHFERASKNICAPNSSPVSEPKNWITRFDFLPSTAALCIHFILSGAWSWTPQTLCLPKRPKAAYHRRVKMS